MRYLVVEDDADVPTLCEAIVHLRARQLACVIPSTAAEVAADVDELLEMLLTKLTASA